MAWGVRQIAYIAISAALWSILNALISPYFFAMTKLPFICDMLGVVALMLVSWKIRRFGAATTVGVIATILTLSLNPMMVQFIGFGAASIVFDLIARAIGYGNIFGKCKAALAAIPSVAMAFTSGIIIAVVFMKFGTANLVLWWGALHAAGGAIGTVIGIVAIEALGRRIRPDAVLNA